jgi:hypothetical protein
MICTKGFFLPKKSSRLFVSLFAYLPFLTIAGGTQPTALPTWFKQAEVVFVATAVEPQQCGGIPFIISEVLKANRPFRSSDFGSAAVDHGSKSFLVVAQPSRVSGSNAATEFKELPIVDDEVIVDGAEGRQRFRLIDLRVAIAIQEMQR